MARAAYLNDEERIQIRIYKEEGYSNRAIAKKIGRSECVIRNLIKKGINYGIKKKTKGNKKLTKKQIRAIKRLATKKKLNCSQVKVKLGLPVTRQHIARILRTDDNIKWTKLMGKPKLTERHIENRLLFAQRHMCWIDEWKKVIFSDEKKFNLDGPDCYSCYWHDIRDKSVVRSKRNFGGGSVMVWGAFHYGGKLPICYITTRMNSSKYNELLEDVLISFLDENSEDSFTFQQDNASIHVSKQSLEWFRQKQITVMEWPACSPDLNPIENLWGILASKVYENGRQFNTVIELKDCIKGSWGEIEPDVLKNLVDSMPRRVFETIKSQGGHTKY